MEGRDRNFFVELPRVLGVPEPLAGEFGRLNGVLFDFEKANPGSIFAKRSGESVSQRLKPGFSIWPSLVPDAKLGALEYSLRLADFRAASDGVNRCGEKAPSWMAPIGKWLEAKQDEFPEVAKLMTVEQASTDSNWD